MRTTFTVAFAAVAGLALAACQPTAMGDMQSVHNALQSSPGTTTTTTTFQSPSTITTVNPQFSTTIAPTSIQPTTIQPLNTSTVQTFSQPITSAPSFTIRGTGFSRGSDNLLSTARADLDAAAESIRNSGGQYSIVGYASTEGNDDANQRLSERRAASVAAYLVGKGVPSSALIVAGAGETTQFGSDLESNRRVVISPRSSVITGTQTVTTQPIITTTQPLILSGSTVPVAPSIVIAN